MFPASDHALYLSPSPARLAAALHEQIGARLRSGRRTAVLLPTVDAGHALRARLGEAGEQTRLLQTLTPGNLLTRLAGARGLDPEPVAARSLLRRALATLPGDAAFAPLAARPGLHTALLATFAALQDGMYLDPARLADAVAALPDPAPRLRELGTLYAAYQRAAPAVLDVSEPPRMTALNRASAFPALFNTDTLFVHGLTAFSPLEQALLQRIAWAARLTVYLPYGPGRIFAPLAPVIEWLQQEVGCTPEILPEAPPPALTLLTQLQHAWPERSPESDAAPVSDASFAAVSVPNQVRQVAEAVREVLAALATGVAPAEIAVLSLDDADLDLAAARLEALAVPVYRPRGPSPLRGAAGAALSTLLNLAGSRYRRGDLLELLASAPLRLPPDAAPARWERISRAAGVTQGRDAWAARLARYESDHRAEAARAAERGEADKAEELLETAGQTAHLRAVALTLIDRLEALPQRATPAEHVAALRALATDWIDAPDLDPLLLLLEQIAGHQGADAELDFATVREQVHALLDGHHPAVRAYGEGLFLGRPEDAAALRFRLLLLLGACEGVLPAVPAEDPLLPDAERALLDLPRAAERAAAAPLAFRLLLAAATERLVLLYPRAEPGGNRPRLPSYYLLKAGETLLGRSTGYAGVEQIPGFRRVSAGRVAPEDADTAIDAAERALALVERAALMETPDPSLLNDALGDDAEAVLARLAALRTRRSARRFTPLDGVFTDPAARERLAAKFEAGRRTLAPTALETWAACPFRFFAGHVLSVRPDPDPDVIERLEARDRGSLLHEVLERFYRGLRDDGLLPLDRAHLDTYVERLLAMLDAVCTDAERAGRGGHRLLWAVEREGMADDLLLTLDADLKRAADGFVPFTFEQGFGGRGRPAAELPLPDGRTVRFSGLIDRVDRHPDGRLRVIDYKTGRRPDSIAADRLHKGTVLQPPIYLLAAHTLFDVDLDLLEAELYYSSRRGELKRKPFSGPALKQRQADLVQIVETALTAIQDGRYFPHPGENDNNCTFCDFTEVCDRAVARHWRRKQADPAAAAFIALHEIA